MKQIRMADERYKARGTRGLETMGRLAGSVAKLVGEAASGAYRDFEASVADTDDAGGARPTAEAARAFIFEKLAGSAESLKLDPEDVLHFLRHRAEDYWLLLMTRWESVSRDVVDELLSEAAHRQTTKKPGRVLWSSMERWEGVARFVVEKVVDTSIGIATAKARPSDARSKEAHADEPSPPSNNYAAGPSWLRKPDVDDGAEGDDDGPWMFD